MSFGVYVHWPYCTAICPYCDFNVYRARGADSAPLLSAIIADMEAHAERFGRRRAETLFLGGGTPSLLRGDDVGRLIDAASRVFGLAADAEITLEANPENWPLFAEHCAAGVNRLSVGVQALDDAALKTLGRSHDSATSVQAVEAAAKACPRVSVDLIYAREGQGVDGWRDELSRALALPVEHVSLYQLTIEADTAFARKVARGALAPPDVELAAQLYEATQEVCDAAGVPAYEISNHARSASAQARHNLIYWRSGDWIGIGPGAHGRITHAGSRLATEAQRRPGDYIDAVRENGLGWIGEASLTAEEAGDEVLIMGLRIVEGLDLARLEHMRGRPLNAHALAWLREQNLVEQDGARVRLTPSGRLVANQIAAELAA
ncbi:MAG TPA: radical SAM family heme chaperone HemW [Caulobacterales bacterium]|nr:radical SAM family heme chaperone HemW [Caulobacterales bacterium]